MDVGILGGGNISATHARAAVAAGCRVAAVYGQNADKTAAIAREHGVPAYPTLAEFLSHRPMDLVAIGSPSGVHAAHITAVAQRGLHVLVEKPLEITLARADQAIAAVRAAGVTLGVFFQDRVQPDLLRVKQLLNSGSLGRPILASGRVKWYRRAEYYRDSQWRGTWALDGGGALMNQGIHTVDALVWLLGPVASVCARVATACHDIEVEDTLVATIEFCSGALATYEATTAAYPGYLRRIEITGTEGTVLLEGDRLVAVDLRTPAALAETATDAASPAVSQPASSSSPVMSDIVPHRRVFEDFIDAVGSGRAPACDGDEGRKSLAVVEAMYASARSGKAVLVSGPHPGPRSK